jgi:starch synthase
MSQPKTLFISQEIVPYLPSSPMAEISNKIPHAIAENGYEVRMFMPKYGCINERRNQLHEVIRLSGMNIIINDTDHPLIIKVATLSPSRMQVYFIDNDDYFRRHPATELEINSDADENDERSIFFVRGVAETIKKLRWDPVVIHCAGWITSLMPLYIKHKFNDDPALKSAKVIYSIYSDELPQPLPATFSKMVKADGISDRYMSAIKNKEVGINELTRLAIDHADALMVADANVSAEILEYAQASGKPLLPFIADPDEQAAACVEFYNTISASKK